jgi:DNA segregation ATPase FtsK/SpoIIIE-like protein
MVVNKKNLLLKKVVFLAIAIFGIISFLVLALFQGDVNGSWFYYASSAPLTFSWWQILGAKIAQTWLYWLGGSAYIMILGMVFYFLPKTWNDAWQFSTDRFTALMGLVLSSTILCQMHGVGSYGHLPGGGVLGAWLTSTFAISTFVWLVVAKSLMWASLVAYSRVYFVGVAHYIVVGMHFVLQPVVNKIANKVTWDWLQSLVRTPALSVESGFQKSVLEHEYAEVLAELEPQIYQDAFWQNYTATTNDFEAIADTVEPEFTQQVFTEQESATPPIKKNIKVLPLPTLKAVVQSDKRDKEKFTLALEQQSEALINKLSRFGVMGEVTAVKPGPVITLFEFTPAEDAKISKIIALENDLALALETRSIRIIAPVPGRAVVGFEVANKVRESVMLTDVLNDARFAKFVSKVKQGHEEGLGFQIPIAIGKDTTGNNVIIDLVKTPHLLVAGSTGAGKSVSLNTILVSLLCANSPQRLRLILIDPKRLEFSRYANIGHLLFPIITNAKKSLLILRWVIKEMERRYELMAAVGVRSMADYNEFVKVKSELECLPYIVIVIDEMADLMMTASKDVEDLIIRIAQMARAAGIHMIIATQRPSVDVVTGLIKVNFPSRISFRVASKADSRTILDCNGAETLLGAGDMLLLNSQSSTLMRAHGAYVTDTQVNEVVDFILSNYETAYLNLDEAQFAAASKNDFAEDELFDDVVDFLKGCDEVSISLLQRKFRIGYNRSARIMDVLESGGYVLTLDNGKMRKVIKDRLE